MDLPAHVQAKALKSGRIAYYWSPHNRDVAAGLPLKREALGTDIEAAAQRARALNAGLQAWRDGRGGSAPDLGPPRGSLRWVAHLYFTETRDFARVSARSKADYRREIDLLLDVPLEKRAGTVGDVPVAACSPRFVDKVYDRLLVGPRGRRPRQANLCVARFARAWDAVARIEPQVMPGENPWRGVVKESTGREKPAATRAQAYALSAAIRAAGHPQLALAPVVCFEWMQRPENVLAGHLTWAHWKPAHRPDAVQIHHHKTGERVWHGLSDGDGPLHPEAEALMDTTERLGIPVVLYRPARGPEGADGQRAPRAYTFRHARAVVRKAAAAAGLPDWLTLDACRHGGLTELGDAGLTESEEMSISAHATPEAKRRYVKRTESRRLSAARKRRAWIEKQAGRQNAPETARQNGGEANG